MSDQTMAELLAKVRARAENIERIEGHRPPGLDALAAALEWHEARDRVVRNEDVNRPRDSSWWDEEDEATIARTDAERACLARVGELLGGIDDDSE